MKAKDVPTGYAVAAGVRGQGVRGERQRVRVVRRREDRQAALQGADEGGVLGVAGRRRRQGVLPERDGRDDRARRRTADEFEVLATNDLGEETLGTPAIARRVHLHPHRQGAVLHGDGERQVATTRLRAALDCGKRSALLHARREFVFYGCCEVLTIRSPHSQQAPHGQRRRDPAARTPGGAPAPASPTPRRPIPHPARDPGAVPHQRRSGCSSNCS